MSPTDSKTPLLNRNRIVSPSPAHQALESNLDMDSNLTLKKKKSWFGSLRNVVQKGALQAKMAVDVFRGEQNQSKQIETEPVDGAVRTADTDQSHIQTDADDDGDPDTASRSSTSLFDNTGYSYPHTIQPPRDKRARGAASTPSRTALFNLSGAEVASQNSLVKETGKSTRAGHKRHTSLARSLAGSIRGLRHGTPKVHTPPPKETPASPEKSAANVPLPSSPIIIPSAAPVVELDLGPAGFMPLAFPSPNEKEQEREDVKLPDLRNITTGRPKSSYLSVWRDDKTPSADNARPMRPRDLLDLPTHSAEAYEDFPDPSGSTPMPGTNLGLEVDGANSDNSDISQVFERSVTPTNEKERKELRTMRSLDAMAEGCNFSDASNDNDGTAGYGKENRSVRATSPEMDTSVEIEFYTPRRDTSSGSTLSSPPSDMAELTRQNTPQPMTTSLEKVTLENLAADDPFTTNESAGLGPPSPDRSVVLPFRPKIVTEKSELIAAADAQKEVTDRGTTDIDQGDKGYIQRPSFSFKTPPETQKAVDHGYTFKRFSLQETEAPFMENLGSDDDTQTRAQDLLTSDIVLPGYETMNSPESNGMSPHTGPLVPELYHRIQTKQSPTPGSARSRTTYTAGLRDCEYKFTFDSWLRSTSMAPAPDEQPQTPHRRSMDVSIDSVSTNDDRRTPQVSPLSTSNGNTPLIDHDSKLGPRHSQHDMEQCDPNQSSLMEEFGDDPIGKTPQFQMIVDSSVEIDGNAFQYADFEHAYASSRAGSPRRDSKAAGCCSDEDDTGPISLEAAAADYALLEESLDRIEGYSKSSPASRETAENFNPTAFRDEVMLDSGLQEPSASGHRFPTPPLPQEDASGIVEETIIASDDIISSSPTAIHIEDDSPSTYVSLLEASSTPTQTDQIPHPQVSESSADFSPIRKTGQVKQRVTSLDTLDDSLRLFSSPDSGYDADKGSVSPPEMTKGPPASRYHSLRKRDGAKKALGELSHNVV